MRKYKFSVEDIKRLLKQIVILVDSREKKNSHILEYFEKNGIAYRKEKLEYGDYTFLIPTTDGDIYFHRDCVLERKASLEELSGNLAQERERFEKEFLKAGNDGAGGSRWLQRHYCAPLQDRVRPYCLYGIFENVGASIWM